MRATGRVSHLGSPDSRFRLTSIRRAMVGSTRIHRDVSRLDRLDCLVVDRSGGKPGLCGHCRWGHRCLMCIGVRGNAPRLSQAGIATPSSRHSHCRSWPISLTWGLAWHFLDSEDEVVRTRMADGGRSSPDRNDLNGSELQHVDFWLRIPAWYRASGRAMCCASWCPRERAGLVLPSCRSSRYRVALHAR